MRWFWCWSRRAFQVIGHAVRAGRPHIGRSWPRRVGHELPDEAEAFLTGHYVEYRTDRAEAVPVWAWTNLLAHGTDDDLRAETSAPSAKSEWEDAPWRQARSFLAAEVLDCAAQHGPLPALQREVLVPLELALASDRRVPKWNPSRWASEVETALAHQARTTE